MKSNSMMTDKMKIVTRFAPSPTGFMHIGSARTALYAWLWARKSGGTFILRIEDTDKEREVAGSVEHILKSLRWLGITWDEGPGTEGPHAPYKQSERLDLYKKYAQILIEKGLAYPDPYAEEEVESFRKKTEEEKKPFLYREYRPDKFNKWDGTKPLRFKVPEVKKYSWHDIVYGDLSAGEEALDDFVLIKGDGYPTYNFAHIVDDIEMGVTHVMRGVEFIASTPKFLSVYDALRINPPFFVTLPPILAPGGKKKLGKRDGAKDILEYEKEGYLPQAVVNFLSLLGWNPGDEREVFTVAELIEAFDLSKIGRSGARANFEKLDWFNKEHIKRLPKEKIAECILTRLPEDLRQEKIVPIVAERISKWSDVTVMVDRGELDFFRRMPALKKQKLLYKNATSERIRDNLKKVITALENIKESEFDSLHVKDRLMTLSDSAGGRGEVLHPVRYALSGLDSSPDPFVISDTLGKEETLHRLENAIDILDT